MNWKERIITDPEILVGKPVIKGSRIAVEFIISRLAEGWTEEQILSNYPGLEKEDITACRKYAAEVLETERVYPVAV